MRITIELPENVIEEWRRVCENLDVSQMTKEALLLEAYRRGYFGTFTPKKRARLPFDQLPDRLKSQFEAKLRNHMLDFADWKLDHEVVVKKALEDWYEEGEGEEIGPWVELGGRLSAITGRDRGELLLEMRRIDQARRNSTGS
jgi:hypothetical protein